MLDDGERLVPGFKQARALRVWTGVRPLFEDRKEATRGSTRDVTRAHALLDHRERDGVDGFLTITGGKLTTYRLMAEETVNAVCRQLGETASARPRPSALRARRTATYLHVGQRLQAPRADAPGRPADLRVRADPPPAPGGDDPAAGEHQPRRHPPAPAPGMGPCQGGFCIYRATGILHALDGIDGEQASGSLGRLHAASGGRACGRS